MKLISSVIASSDFCNDTTAYPPCPRSSTKATRLTENGLCVRAAGFYVFLVTIILHQKRVLRVC